MPGRFAFIQPFGVNGLSGGARILRSVLAERPEEVVSLNTCVGAPADVWHEDLALREYGVPTRPHFRRIENSRLASLAQAASVLWDRDYRERLIRRLRELRPDAVHLVPHGTSFLGAYEATRELGLPLAISVHDDLRWTLRGNPLRGRYEKQIATLWRESDTRFVICDELGKEYCRRYGERDFAVHRDGRPPNPRASHPETSHSACHLYFMGILHLSYIENFESLFAAASRLRDSGVETTITLRGVTLPSRLDAPEWVNCLPAADEATIQEDMRRATVLYLPLPMAGAERDFVRYSFSTKAVAYLGSGKPILYHGPSDSALGRYLTRTETAATHTESTPDGLRRVLARLVQDNVLRRRLRKNALEAAAADFSPSVLHGVFWQRIQSLKLVLRECRSTDASHAFP